jgi:hypothetical protein
MSLIVTEKAKEMLEEIIRDLDLEPDRFPRLVFGPVNNVHFVLDEAKDEDHVVKHGERIVVLVVPPSLDERLSGQKLDVQETEKGKTLGLLPVE